MIELPIDANSKPIQIRPAKSALAVTYDATISTATDITLNAATTFLQVSAIDKGVFLRYASTASSTNYDEYIDANTTVQLEVPSGVTVISVIQQSASAAVSIIEK